MTDTHRNVIRRATVSDIDHVVELVERLLRELSGDSRRSLPQTGRTAARDILDDATLGLILLAESPGGTPSGILSASFPAAVRQAGRYALIEELYVMPDARGEGLGGRLVARLIADLPPNGVSVVEVGLPGSRFPGQSQARSFYALQGFKELGPRSRLHINNGEREQL
jgi:GNAT superfamily N-acetyltransferase